jgi:single-stranded DNA-specific DHH superfamily exonuclease
MNEIVIQGSQNVKQYFEDFINLHDEVFIEESSGHDGQKIISLIIENLPEILGAVTALITVIRAKNIIVKITKDGKEISNLED